MHIAQRKVVENNLLFKNSRSLAFYITVALCLEIAVMFVLHVYYV